MRSRFFLVLALLCFAAGVVNSQPISLAEALDNNTLVWGDGPASVAPWFGQTAVTHDGVDAGRSGAVWHGEQSDLSTVVQGPGTLSFWWKVSSEHNPSTNRYDILYFWYGESQGMSYISGEVDWTYKVVNIPAGTYTVYWSYSKDISGSAGMDAGFVDQVVWTPEGAPAPPPDVSGFMAVAGDGEVELSWVNPADASFETVRIQRSLEGHPSAPESGTTVYAGSGQSYTDTGLANGVPVYYTAFSVGPTGLFSDGVEAQATPRKPPEFRPGDFTSLHWEQTLDMGAGDDVIRGVAFDNAGNLIVVGDYQASTKATVTGAYVRAISPDGESVVWEDERFTGILISPDRFIDVCVDPDGNVIAVGTLAGDFPPYHNAVLVHKYEPDGSFLWQTSYHSGAWSEGRSVTTDLAGNIYVAGREFGGWDDRQGQWTILKYSPAGVLQAGFPIVHNHSTTVDWPDIAFGVEVDASGNIFAAGYIGINPGGHYDWHVRSYTPSGVLRWQDTYSGPGLSMDQAHGTAIDSVGDLYVAGRTQVDGESVWLVIKYAGGGSGLGTVAKRLWVQTYFGRDDTPGIAYAAAMYNDDTLLVAGEFENKQGYNQGALLRIDAATGTLLGRQEASHPTVHSLRAIATRCDMIGTGGMLHNGNDWDFAFGVYQMLPDVTGTFWVLW